MNNKKTENLRHFFQSLWALITNSFFVGFKEGKIFSGELKKFCLPGLNCYSCPGALGSCPIGAMQAVVGLRNFKFSFYVSGFLIFVGAVFGRFVCGWLCPFGLVQDLIYKIPFIKKVRTFRLDKYLRKVKYVIFLVFVILLPMFAVDITGLGEPYFCKWICPAGTLEGGIPLILANEMLRGAIGFLFRWKVAILIVLLVLSVLIYRPFCKYICPLGAVYSLFNRISVFGIKKDDKKCVSCTACNKVCKMNVDVMENPNSAECIRCGICVKNCPTGALSCAFAKNNSAENKNKLHKEDSAEKSHI